VRALLEKGSKFALCKPLKIQAQKILNLVLDNHYLFKHTVNMERSAVEFDARPRS
jgi:hypothetical protein